MARETFHRELQCIALTREEAANLIALLAAQLGDTHIRHHQVGAAFDTVLSKETGPHLRLVISLEPDKPGS